MMQRLFMVFDVESVGLHGEGFAVAYVVTDRAGVTLEEQVFACDPTTVMGSEANRHWVSENVPVLEHNCANPKGIRDAFWHRWKFWREAGAALVADCCWPVEARFLATCVSDRVEEREWEGPYPLYDLASIMLARGLNPLQIHARLANELPAHHPLNDARQSARLLLGILHYETIYS